MISVALGKNIPINTAVWENHEIQEKNRSTNFKVQHPTESKQTKYISEHKKICEIRKKRAQYRRWLPRWRRRRRVRRWQAVKCFNLLLFFLLFQKWSTPILMCVHVCEYDHYYRWSDCFIFTAHHQSIHFSSFSSFIFLFLQHVCAKWRFVFKFEYVFEGKVNRRKSYDNTHTDTRKKPARNGKHWEHKRYWPNQNRIRMRKYVMNVVSSMKRSIDAWAVSTDHTISIFLSLAIGFARLQINEYSRSDKKDWKCCFKLNLLGKSVFVKIIFYEHFGRVWTWNRSPKEETNRSFGDCK